MPRPYTEKRKAANEKWDAANLDRISIALPKGRKEIIKDHALQRGESMNAFIIRAVDNQMERDKEGEIMARSREPHIVIDPEFEALIPPLTGEEYNQLKENIYDDGGIHDPIILWCDFSQSLNTESKEGKADPFAYNYFIIDGHNRWKILEELRKEHPGEYFKWNWITEPFENRTEAMAWIIRNQLGRRNLPDYERARLALRLKETIAAEAKGNQASHTEQGYQKTDKAVNTNKELAKVAGVSHDTIHKVDVIERKAPEEVKEQLRRGEVSINKAYNKIKDEGQKKLIIVNEEHQKANISGFSVINKPPAPKNYSYTNPQKHNNSYDPAIYSAAQDRLIKTINANLDFYVDVIRDILKREKSFVTDDIVENAIKSAGEKLDAMRNDYYKQTL